MKKFIVLSLMLIVIFPAISQNCKYYKNEIDIKTGENIKITKKKEIFYRLYDCYAHMSASNINDSYSFTFDFTYDAPFAGKVTTFEGCELTFLLQDGKIISLKKNKINYPVTKKQIKDMLNSEVKSFNYQYGNNPGKAKSVDVELKDRQAENITELIKCVYN